MSPRAVDQLNLGLMIAALALAFALPFETFLLAYAILGPLHYVTEISWLHERRYFLPGKRDWMWIAAVALLAVLGAEFLIGPWHVPFLKSYSYAWASLAFALAFAFLLPTGAARAAVAVVLAAVILTFGTSTGGRDGWFLASLFLTTILHVCVFTGAFMLYGALKTKSTWGYVTVAAFAVGCAIALLAPASAGGGVGDYARESYTSGFWPLNGELARLFHLGTAPAGSPAPFRTTADLFASSGGIAVMRLIAFAYTYHYLNWFSKTSIIRWHQVHKAKLAAAIVIWVASVALYARDYTSGAKWLFALSYAHVLLEFPLNLVSFRGIGSELVARVRGGAARV